MLKRWGQQLSRSRWVASLMAGVIRLYGATLRWEIVEEAGLRWIEQNPSQPLIVAFWHNRILGILGFWLKFRTVPTLVVLISQSRDGEFIARVIEALGLCAERGSSSRGGAQVLRRLVRTLREQRLPVGITPDGPRGPQYTIQPGVMALAQLSGVPVLPWTVCFDRSWTLNSWDRFQIPQPFARGKVYFQPVLTVPPETQDPHFSETSRQLVALLGGDRRPEF